MTTDVVECPQCGRLATLDPDAQPVCLQCDSPLVGQAPRRGPAPDVAAAPITEAGPGQTCGRCGHRAAAGRDFCESCGTPLRSGPIRQRTAWVAPVSEEDHSTRRRRVLTSVAVVVIAALLFGALIFAIWYFFVRSSPWQTRTLDIGNASWDISATLLNDRPVISYVDAGNLTVRLLACGTPECTAHLTTVAATSLGASGRGQGTAIAVTEDGLPVIAFRAGNAGALAVVACGTLICTDPPDPGQLDPQPPTAGADAAESDTGYNPSIVIGADGLPLISYWDQRQRALMSAHCTDATCSTATLARLTEPATAGDADSAVGGDTAIVRGPSRPMIAFRGEDPTRLDLLSCTDDACTSGKIVTLVPRLGQPNSAALLPGYENAIALDRDGFAIVAYHDRSDNGIYVVRCLDEACNAVDGPNEVDASGDAFHSEPSIALLNGRPVIAYRETPKGDESGRRLLMIVRCGDESCSRKSEPEVVDGSPPGRIERAWRILSRKPSQLVGRVGYSPAVNVTSDGRVVIAYGDATAGSLRFAISR